MEILSQQHLLKMKRLYINSDNEYQYMEKISYRYNSQIKCKIGTTGNVSQPL